MKYFRHLRPIVAFILIGLIITTLSRLVLFFIFETRIEQTPDYWHIFPIGLRFDLIILCYLSFLPLAIISLIPDKYLLFAKRFLNCYFIIFLTLILMMEISSPDFIKQYDTRPNRIFLDYLIYPREVLGTLFKSYLSSIIITIVLLTAFVTMLVYKRKKIFVDTKIFRVRKVEYFSENLILEKTLFFKDIVKSGKYWIPKLLEMKRQNGNYTIMNVQAFKPDVDLDDAVFSESFLIAAQ